MIKTSRNNDDSMQWVVTERDKAAVSARETMQGIIDHVFVAIAEQGAPAMTPHGSCMYTMTENDECGVVDYAATIDKLLDPQNTCLHCAVGHLLTDAELRMVLVHRRNMGSVDEIAHVLPKERAEWMSRRVGDTRVASLIIPLQRAHDGILLDAAKEPKAFVQAWCERVLVAVEEINSIIGDLAMKEHVNADIVSSWRAYKEESGEW